MIGSFSPSRVRRVFTLCCVGLVALALLSGCGRRRKKKRRSDTLVSFRLKNLDHHWNVITSDSARLSAAAKSVVVSPNLLFRANHPTSPLQLKTKDTKAVKNILIVDGHDTMAGEPVRSEVSALLFERMEKRGVGVLSPALGQRLGGCKDGACTNSTWVERALMAAPTETSAATGLLAVARLLVGGVDIPVIVREGEDEDDPDFIVRQRTSPYQGSLCDNMTLFVPGAQLMAEFVETSSGRVLARFDEAQFYKLPRKRRTVETDFGDLDLCAGVRSAFTEAIGDDRRGFNNKALADKLFQDTIDRVF